ncbi:hypothetical protein ACH5RR_018973 [Cinchona calisaya]|uniref:Uncharacterized protein n=1 Tax=Cinchona calisaya TaxID=153742 RepID=A0ABD2ZND4_9GENT
MVSKTKRQTLMVNNNNLVVASSTSNAEIDGDANNYKLSDDEDTRWLGCMSRPKRSQLLYTFMNEFMSPHKTANGWISPLMGYCQLAQAMKIVR